MNTAFLLMAQYNAAAIIPIELVCRDYFSHLTPVEFARKAGAGQIDIPITRIENGNRKAARGIHLQDLANWIDARREAAQKECDQLQGRR
ncbi:pyocin activator PrtN family protein [Kaistia adipata]|uniref:pyocin activator PrtN family protein n=1 Tax=Kaistia adipata TaxID=166954 RepID=UPI0003F511A3|nr:pyocin activator PrtN family protein [Kaistia adipata]